MYDCVAEITIIAVRNALTRHRFSVLLLAVLCLPLNHFLVASVSEGIECSMHGASCSCPLMCAAEVWMKNAGGLIKESCHGSPNASVHHEMGHQSECAHSMSAGCAIKAACQSDDQRTMPDAHPFVVRGLVHWIVTTVPQDALAPDRVEVLEGHLAPLFHPPQA
ncbi:MAG TPA: hypothetical protein VGK99_17300 [Acidobacteriota bacterium]